MRLHSVHALFAALFTTCATACGGAGGDGEAVPEPVRVAPVAGDSVGGDSVGGDEAVPDEPVTTTPPVDARRGVHLRWWVVVRGPDGERRFQLEAARFYEEVAGYACSADAVGVSQEMRIVNGRASRSAGETRVLLCERGAERRAATAHCGYTVEDGRAVPLVEPARLELGPPPHQVILSCDVEPEEETLPSYAPGEGQVL